MAENKDDSKKKELREFAKRIKMVRGHLGKNQHDFADLLDVNYNSVAAWEQGRNKGKFSTFAPLVQEGINVSFIFDKPGGVEPLLANGDKQVFDNEYVYMRSVMSAAVKDALQAIDILEIGEATSEDVANLASDIYEYYMDCKRVNSTPEPAKIYTFAKNIQQKAS